VGRLPCQWAVALAVFVVMSVGAYYLLEKPAIDLGARLTGPRLTALRIGPVPQSNLLSQIPHTTPYRLRERRAALACSPSARARSEEAGSSSALAIRLKLSTVGLLLPSSSREM
jgi:peptidoglycan/LPS O-acetylase OafA/YrhL